MKKILLISYYYFPINAPHSNKWQQILKLLPKDYKVDVITSLPPGEMEHEKKGNINIYRVGNIFDNQRNQMKSKDNGLSDKKKISLKERILKKLYKIWKKIYYPDFSVLGLNKFIEISNVLFKKNDYDEVITVSFPFTPHLVGLYLKNKKYKFRWHVEIGDPFYLSDNNPFNNKKLYNRLNYYLDKLVMKKSDRIYFYNEVKRDYEELFPFISNKSIEMPVIYYGNTDNSKGGQIVQSTKKSTIDFLFVGTLYRKIRNPYYILKLFSSLSNEDYTLTFVGNISDCQDIIEQFQPIFNGRLRVIPPVSKSKVEEYINCSDVLINIGNDSKYQLPSKVVEYVASRKYILNFYNLKEDTSKKFLEEYPKAYNIDNGANFEKNRSLLDEIISNFDTGLASEAIVDSIIEKHLPENILKLYDF